MNLFLFCWLQLSLDHEELVVSGEWQLKGLVVTSLTLSWTGGPGAIQLPSVQF